ncbi:probable fucosyltransferase 8 [Abrus precatorius]|uniref:Fucosyltransferase n=1 Tax=Abrus precatorius TaxID=3816 RepID=A0A8B8LQF8_ABRPR|nr:probable fucosyltransferase 8 [Abrus precatorius]XP_027357668.1 probable fucosyltransferase 8 [Abrus precatorius]
MDWLEFSSKRIGASLAIFAIAFSLIILTLTPNYGYFEEFLKSKVINGKDHNVTTKDIAPEEITQKVNDKAKEDKNFTGSNEGSKTNASERFDGLIVLSRFDEGSCLSRFKSYLYHRASPHKPSPYLISKLRNYEDLHQSCGPNTAPYNRTMTMLQKHRTNATYECNYVVWTTSDGLGNRIVSMVSAFLYAILTDRVLLVEFKDDMVGLFCEPFPNSSWILPKDFPFRKNKGHVRTYDSILKKHKENNSKEILPSVLNLMLRHTPEDHERFLRCDDSQHLLQEVPFLFLCSNQYFVPSLFMVPSFSQELSKMFPKKDTVFHHLGRYLFHPSNEAWGPISRFYEAYLAKADERIGIQIRVFNPHESPYQTVMNQVLNCTLKNNILPNISTEDSKHFAVKNRTLKSVLVASLYPMYGENLRTTYLTRPTVSGDVVSVHQPSHEGHQKFNDKKHNLKAWSEMYLLSLCDVLVTSSASTFGYVAQSLRGLKPWVLHNLQNQKIQNPQCVRDFSMEPCYHFPPKLDCMGKPIDDIGKAFPYIRRCQDYEIGVKLVNDYE